MAFIAIVAVIGLAVLLTQVVGELRSDRTDFGIVFMMFLFIPIITAVVACVVYFAVAAPVGHATGVRPIHDPYTFPIVAAADGSQTEGSLFLFGGTINEEPVYFFYRQGSDGSIRQGHVNTESSVIYEDTETEGYVVVNRYREHCTTWGCAVDLERDQRRNKYEIHVPPGSVKRQFNFDLE